MITRVIQRKRPRGPALLVMGGAVVAAALFAAVALALVSDIGTHSVIVADKEHSSGLVDIGNASVEYIGSSSQTQSSGTGIFDPFVRLQGSPTENGYNTNGAVQFDTKSGQWTKAILASAIPIVDCDGDPLTAGNCWELFVDINESNTAKYISLTRMEIWFATSPTLVGYNETTHTFASGATKQYDFIGEIKIHDVNQGSGRGDLRYLVPVISFTATDWFVLYSEWGSPDAAPDGKTFGSEGGFEEWKVRKAPNVTIVKTADPLGPVNAGTTIGFDITISNTGAAAATNVVLNDQLPTAGGLNWSLVSAVTGCTLSATDFLSCTFATLASGASITIELTSPTTAAACGLVENTASFTADGDLSGSDDADVTVNCGALMILKQSTKTGNPLVANAGAEFLITGPNSYSNSVIDNSTEDEDTTVGEVCVSGLAPGAYTVNETTAPSGYGDAGQTDVAATVANGTDCGSSQPTLANTAVFTNAPLADLLVRVDGQSSGEIASSISCVDSGSTVIGSVGTVTPVDPAEVDVNDLEPGTYTCTVVIDP